MANVEDHVIPIRLDMEEGQYKLKDTFMWNCSGKLSAGES
jgi:SWI/SNF-related matrix-associated actin-dependent regulator of chromatin subfamily B protein 1